MLPGFDAMPLKREFKRLMKRSVSATIALLFDANSAAEARATLGVRSDVERTAAAGGTADAITAMFSPNVTLLTNGLRVRVTGLSSNATTTPTLAAGTTAATTIKNPDGTAISIGQIGPECDFVYSSALTGWLLQPAGASKTQADTDNSTKTANTAFVRQFRQIAQVAVARTTAVATGTTIIPLDDTIPQQTEGDQYLSVTITPKNASSLLEIDVRLNIANSGSSGMIVALFQDSTANALAASTQIVGTGLGGATLRYTMTAGTTSATTFKVRAGSNGAGTTTVNGNGGAAIFGGTSESLITVKEHLP